MGGYFELGRLLLYRPLFMTELLAAAALFSFSLRKRKGAWWRIPLAILLCYASCFIYPTISNSVFNILSFTTSYLFVFAGSFLIFESDWKTLLFCIVAGYNLQHAAYESYDLILHLFHLGGAGSFYESTGGNLALFSSPIEAVVYFLSYLVMYYLAYIIFARRIKRGSPISIHNGFVFGIGIFCILSNIVVNSVALEFVQDATNSVFVIIAFLSLLLCIIAMTTQFELATRFKLDSDIATLKVVRSKEREQYRVSKQNAELLAIKAHDLKHQIHELGTRKSIASETIEEISSLVDIYDSDVKTGNPSMDMVLTEKTRLCTSKQIHLSLMADGTALECLSESDIYSLLGNILDNAIEATVQLPEGQRSISLTVKKAHGFAHINADNPYMEKNLRFGQDGLPLTSKENKANHGYGIKSIAYVAEKYHGDLSIKAEDGVFSLSVMIPLDQSSAS